MVVEYIEINGMKGMWTLDEVIKLIQDNNLKVKIIFDPKKDGDRGPNGMTHLTK
jgi:hypothetical protein